MSVVGLCNARQPGGVNRCELSKSHRGVHAAGTATWSSHRQERQARLQQTRMDKHATAKQSYRQGRLAGIRDERLREQRTWRVRPNTGAANYHQNWCERCEKTTDPEQLQLHHYTQRSLGKRATPDDMGDERPEELALICQGPGSCHDGEHA